MLRNLIVILGSLFAAVPALASERALPVTTATTPDAAPLVLAAPPRESERESQRLYQPVADYLTRALGRPVVYRYPGTWGVYRSEMLKGSYDLVFDGPHFNSYRVERLGHEILVQLPGSFQYAVILRADHVYTGLKKLAGHRFCTLAPPNLGALVLLSLFDNPMRQPILVAADNWDEIYRGVTTARCDGGVMPLTHYQRYAHEGKTKVLFHSAQMPNQALSAGLRVNAMDRRRITEALTATEALVPTAALRASWNAEQFVAGSREQYLGLAEYLRNEWGFY